MSVSQYGITIERLFDMKYRQFLRPVSIEEAWALNQKRSNRILGGTLWMRMASYSFANAIDLSGLGLDNIEDCGDEIRIGCMTSLHSIERSDLINGLCSGAARDALVSIVGVQFRNCATVGGSIFGRFGFSDVLTLFMALDADVVLHKAGRMPITEFSAGSWGRDILTHVIITKQPVSIRYLSQRNTKTDFPVLTCAVSRIGNETYATIGARPMRAVRLLIPDNFSVSEACEYAQNQLVFGSNMRASAEYRRHIAGVLLKRGLESIGRCDK